jgi:hypothetical protein
MLPERRRELLARRGRFLERRRRQLAEEQRRDFTAPLDRAGVAYVLADDESLMAWIAGRFTIDQSSSIEWETVAQRQCVAAEGQDPSAWLGNLADEKALGDPIVAVVFAASTAPSVRMRYGEFVAHADIVVDFNWQTWVFDPGSDWVIEFHHDLRWCWGRSA